MIEVSNTTAVTLTPGQSITFNDVVYQSKCCNSESFRSPGTSVRGGVGLYELEFHGNIASGAAATPIQLNIAVDGAPLPETTMISTPANANEFNNVAAATYYGNQQTCGNPFPGSFNVTVTNTGTATLTVAPNASLKVGRKG